MKYRRNSILDEIASAAQSARQALEPYKISILMWGLRSPGINRKVPFFIIVPASY